MRIIHFIAGVLILHILIAGVPVRADGCPDDFSEILMSVEEKAVRLKDSIIDGTTYMRWAAVFNQSCEMVWSVLIDPDAARQVMGKLKSFDIIEQQGNHQTVHCTGKPHWLMKTFKSVLALDLIHNQGLTWRQESGDLKAFAGFWRLYGLEDGRTLAIYGIHFDPGNLLPGFMVHKGIKKEVPRMMQKLKERLDNGQHNLTERNSVPPDDTLLTAEQVAVCIRLLQ
ncbi:MAG: hypothetical protein JW763_02290 [candidate division Zixibacteria bacterium]|nr:hypothetical protein [candidate division Zixibacteria bacterium]